MNLESSYVNANKRARVWRSQIKSDTYAANRVFKEELSSLPAGAYVICLYFILEAKISQDGNGGDGVNFQTILNLINRIQIVDNFGTLVDVDGLNMLAQHFKLQTGHNPLYSGDVAASTGASTVYTSAIAIVPLLFAQPLWRRPYDTVIPSNLLQDATLSVSWNNDVVAAAHASNATVSASLKVIAECEYLNRATIPPALELLHHTYTDATFHLSKGNYQHLWITNLDLDTNFHALTTIRMDADGAQLIDAARLQYMQAVAGWNSYYVDDEMWQAYDPQELAVWVYPTKNNPPQDSATYRLTGTHGLYPLYTDGFEKKFSEILRVENRLNVTLGGTACSKAVCYARYRNHSASELEAKARRMGFGEGTLMVNRTSRRQMQNQDAHLSNILPVRLVQADVPKLR